MRYPFVVLLVVTLVSKVPAQTPPNCTGSGRDLDARCACVKDPGSKLCEMVKAGFYDQNRITKFKPVTLDWTGLGRPSSPSIRTAAPAGPVRTVSKQARVVPLTHKDYVRFLPPDAQLVAGVELAKLFRAQEVLGGLFAPADGSDASRKALAALQEVDRLWLSIAPPNDVLVVMTGRFEQGAMAGLFYAQGVMPVFLGGSQAMMIGPEPSMQAALARLAKPAPDVSTRGWAVRRALELSKDHETWFVSQKPLSPSATTSTVHPLEAVRQFALGMRISGNPSIAGEIVTDSESSAAAVNAWIGQMKAALRDKTGLVGPLDPLRVEQSGAALQFSATGAGNGFLSGEAGRAAMRSDFGVGLYGLVLGSLPGSPSRTVAEEKLLAVKEGMKREDVLNLVGPPLSVVTIQGLELPRETWTYQVPFGRQYTVRLDGGAVSRTGV